MALQSSGAISLGDLRTEYVGDSAAISLGSLYRGGSNSIVKANASNNNSTNLSAGVPTSGAISLNDFYSQEKGFKQTVTASTTNVNVSSYFGDDYTVDYPKTVVINSGVTISSSGINGSAMTYASGAAGDLTLTVNGTVSAKGGTCVKNSSSKSIALKGSGTVDAQDTTDWVSALQTVGGSVQVNFLGGFGGASGPDIYHSDYGSNMQLKVTRVTSTIWGIYWTFNELDYSNRGAGYAALSSSDNVKIPQNADGSFDTSDTSDYSFSTNVTSYGRDTRNIAFGSKVISGTRYMWFGTNNKSTSMDLANNRYIQHGHTQTNLTTSNSKHGSLLQTYSATRFSGTVSTTDFSGTLS